MEQAAWPRFWPTLGALLRKLGQGREKGLELPEAEFGSCPSRAPVPVDHLRRPVSGAIGDPSFRLAVREAQGDEGAPQVVCSQLAGVLTVLVELRAVHPGSLQVSTQQGSELPGRKGLALLLCEQQGTRFQLAELHVGAQCGGYVGIHCPCPRVVGLVLGEAHRAAF
ncbi:MAG TPA: hypothetical protein VFQ61_36300 [Polyangiaceae bacterium]|nr:hypothetical protein [Polyangiaceae bacterium]